MLKYRSDIDGLRAVAVLSVLFFHAHWDFFAGGFVGVDVFFVISGFLITRIIISHDGSMKAFFGNFYERRIRRLVPPAIFVFLFSLVAGVYFLPPDALVEFAQSLLAAVFFVSNFFFLFQADYFDGPAQLKPLLHTWSLSIEEQFYLLFPVFVLLLKKVGLRAITFFYLTVFALSLAIGVYFSLWTEPANAFFNSAGRFWEIALGGLIACLNIQVRQNWLKHALGVMGLVAIAYSALFYDEALAWPGYHALLPTIGTALIIVSNGGIAARLLSVKPMVWIGLISYALYLWHWPIFVYLQYAFATPTLWHFAVGGVLAVIVSIISYWLIERPVRRRVIFKTSHRAFGLFIISSGVLALAAAAMIKTEGLPSRFPSQTSGLYLTELNLARQEWKALSLRGECWVDHRVQMEPVFERCIQLSTNRRNVLVIGDSHAGHLMPGLRSVFPNVQFNLLAADSCTLIGGRPACKEMTDYLTNLGELGYDAIIVSTRFALPRLDGIASDSIVDNNRLPSDIDIENFRNSIEKLRRGGQLYVVGPVPHYLPIIPESYPALIADGDQRSVVRALDKAVQVDRYALRDIVHDAFTQDDKIHFVDPLRYFCPREKCRHFDSKGWPILLDASHLTPRASRELVSNLYTEQGFLSEFEGIDFNGLDLLEFSGPIDWFPLASGEIDIQAERAMSFVLPYDGRIIRQFEFEPNLPVPMSMRFRGILTIDDINAEEDAGAILATLQRGCEHVSSEKMSFSIDPTKGTQALDFSLSLSEGPVDCAQIRIWNKGAELSGRLSGISVVFNPNP